MITLDDRLTSIETQPNTIASDDQPIDPNILKMLCEISDKLDVHQQITLKPIAGLIQSPAQQTKTTNQKR